KPNLLIVRRYWIKSRFRSPGARRHQRSEPGEPLGYFSYCHEPLLGFESRYQYIYSLKQAFTVTIPQTGSGPQGPTGQVANTNTSSFVPNGASARFILADLNGTISACIFESRITMTTHPMP